MQAKNYMVGIWSSHSTIIAFTSHTNPNANFVVVEMKKDILNLVQTEFVKSVKNWGVISSALALDGFKDKSPRDGKYNCLDVI